MSSEIAIKLENVSKCYHVYDKPRDRLLQMLAMGRKQYYREFWALKNLSFEVKKGETIGIIGRNGSGKSTLLQIICGTLNSTSGSVTTRGRIAALLELGAGFNPEFTGRENVYMNGSLLGMTQNEIDACYADIAEFADIGEFIDQPVKTYSSGMFVRLAFSVAMHSRPDILVVDEALSVGDIAFRNKCMEAIQKMVERGVTILFVTHDLGTLQLICSRVLWLSHGELRASGDPVSIVQDYYITALPDAAKTATNSQFRPPQQETGKGVFQELRLDGGEHYRVGDPWRLRFVLSALEDLPELVVALSIYRADGDWLVGQTSRDEHVVYGPVKVGQTCSGAVEFQSICLAPGEYLLALAAYAEDYSICFALTDLCMRFSVRADFPTWGKIRHPCIWSISVGYEK